MVYPDGPEDLLSCEGGLQPPGDYFVNVSVGDESQSTSYEWWEDDVLRGTAGTYSIYDESSGETRKIKLQATRGGLTAADSIYLTLSEPNDPEECEWA